MNTSLSAVLYKVVPVACLLALTTILTGCGPERGDQSFPFVPGVGLSDGGGQLLAGTPDFRHHQFAPKAPQPRHHTPRSGQIGSFRLQ